MVAFVAESDRSVGYEMGRSDAHDGGRVKKLGAADSLDIFALTSLV